jgi:hypothetical protein
MTLAFRIRHSNSGGEMFGTVLSTDGPLVTLACWFRQDPRRKVTMTFERASGWQLLDARWGGGRGGWRLDMQASVAVSDEPAAEEVDEDAVPAREAMN